MRSEPPKAGLRGNFLGELGEGFLMAPGLMLGFDTAAVLPLELVRRI